MLGTSKKRGSRSVKRLHALQYIQWARSGWCNNLWYCQISSI